MHRTEAAPVRAPEPSLHALVSELGAEPRVHFTSLSPRPLWAFLAGYALAVPSLAGTLTRIDDSVAREHRTRLALGAGTLVWLAEGDTAAGYRTLLRHLGRALPPALSLADAPLARAAGELLPSLPTRLRSLLGAEEARDAAALVDGLHSGLAARGIDPTPDRARLAAFERHLQQELGFVAPWSRLVEVWDGAEGSGAARFAARYGAWLRTGGG